MIYRTLSCKKSNVSVVGAFYKQLLKKPRKPCYYFEDQTWTFEDVEDYSNEVANVFNEAGFSKEDVVAIMMNNCPEYVCTWLGLAKLGVISAFINTNLRLTVLAHCINSCKAKAIIFGHQYSTVMEEVKGMLEREVDMYQVGGSITDSKVHDLDKMMTSAARRPPNIPYKPGYDDQLMYIFTSGTTGKPKAARFPNSRFLLITNAAHCLLNLRSDDIIYNPLPLYHVAGGALGVGPALILGIPAVIRTKFSASGYFQDCIKYKCTVGQYIGEMCRYLLASKARPEDRQHKVRLMVGNGMLSTIWKPFVERFGISKVIELYGATEGNVNMGNLDGKVGAIGCIPRCIPESLIPVAIIKVDESTHQPVRNSAGLCIRCKAGETGMFVGAIKQNDPTREYHGYVNKEESNKKIVCDVFKKGDKAFLSGDLVTMDEEGYIYFKDRTGDTYRWKGENVSTSEVESVVTSIIGLRSCMAYGVQVGELEGRAGMVAVEENETPLDLPGLAEGLDRGLPFYARPLFLRITPTMPIMEPLGHGLFFVLAVNLLALARANSGAGDVDDDEYNVLVSGSAIEDHGGCHKLVLVTGKGLHDQAPVACDMVEYVVANSLNLVVGDTLFSDTRGTMIVVSQGGCEKRTYEDNALHHTEVLSPAACEDVRLTMLKVLMEEHVEDKEWDEDVPEDIFTNDGQTQDYGEWKNVISDIWKTDSNTVKAEKDGNTQ